jgi:hypothetical protein
MRDLGKGVHRPIRKAEQEDVGRRRATIAAIRLSAGDITRADVTRLRDKIAERGHYEANRTLALLSVVFANVLDLGFRVPGGWVNPAKGVKRFKEEKRDRWVKPGELPKLRRSQRNRTKRCEGHF